MLRILLITSSALLLAGISPYDTRQEPSPQQPATKIFASIFGKNGDPATPVQSDLSVSVDKEPAQLTGIAPARNEDLLFAVLVDMSKSEAGNADSIKSAVVQIFQTLSDSHGQGYLVLFNDLLSVSKTPLRASQAEHAFDNRRFEGGTALYDAIQRVCNEELSRSKNSAVSRRVILLLSDGEDNASRSPHNYAEAAAEKESVAVFSLTTHSAKAGPRGQQFLKDIAEHTGARQIQSKALLDGIPLLLSAIDEQWSISLLTTQPKDGKLHSLSVKTSQKDIRISAPDHILLQ